MAVCALHTMYIFAYCTIGCIAKNKIHLSAPKMKVHLEKVSGPFEFVIFVNKLQKLLSLLAPAFIVQTTSNIISLGTSEGGYNSGQLIFFSELIFDNSSIFPGENHHQKITIKNHDILVQEVFYYSYKFQYKQHSL